MIIGRLKLYIAISVLVLFYFGTNAQPLSTSLVSTMGKYDIHQMVFNLHIENNTKYVEGYVTINGNATTTLDTLAFRLHSSHTIDSITINNIKQDSIRRTGHEVRVILSSALASGTYFSARIYYHGTAPGNTETWGEGLVTDTSSKGKHYTYTLSCPYFMFHWAPCKEVLTDLIDSVQMSITTDTMNKVGSNGLLVRDSIVGVKHRVTWVTHYPTNYYLICFNVGQFLEYKTTCTIGSNPSFPIINYVYDSTQLKAKTNIYDTLSYFLQHYSNLFGLYPFHKEKFGTCMSQLGGGMEHQTFVNLGINGFDKYLAAHEMSHQWWGDNVTLKTLSDVWLNEGFASYCEYLTAEYFYPSERANYLQTKYNNGVSAGSTSRVYRTDTSSFFYIYDYNTVYEKGAIILHTLRYLINNDTLFFGALAHYQLKYTHHSVTVSDFKLFMESYTSVNLDDFFNQWFYGYGYPVYDIQWNQWSHTLMIVSKHKGSCGFTPLYKTPIEYKLTRTAMSDTVIKVSQLTNSDTFYIDTHGASITDISLDPYLHVLKRVRSKTHDLALGVDNMSITDALFVSPTLFSNLLNIHSSLNKTYNIEVYDLSGRHIYSDIVTSDNYYINTTAWPTGLYLVKVVYEGNTYVNKVIKGN